MSKQETFKFESFLFTFLGNIVSYDFVEERVIN